MARPKPRPRAAAIALHADAIPGDAASRLYVRIAWVVTALFGAALLVMALGPHRIGDNFAETDFYGGYADGARALQQGKVDPSRYGVVGPGYEVALAIAGVVAPDLFRAATVLSAVALVAGLALWLNLLTVRLDARWALGAALFLVLNPTFFRYGYSATNDALAFGLQAASLFFLLARAGPRAALAAGLLGGLAFLTRYNAAVLLPAGLIAILAGGLLPGPEAGRGRLRLALLFTVGFLAPVLPWVLFSLARGGSFSFQFHHNIAYDVFARARGITWDDYQRTLQPQFPNLFAVIARDPGAVLSRLLFNLWDHLRLDATALLGWPVALCAAAGLVFATLDLRDATSSVALRVWRRLWPVALAAGLFFLSLVPNFYSERYGLPLLPFYCTLAAAPFASPRFALAVGAKRRVWLKAALALVPLWFSFQSTARATREGLQQLPVEVLDCAQALRERARPGDRVLCRKPHIAFHGGVQALAFPFTRTLPELADYARRNGARWLFFSWPEAQLRPSYWFLLDTTSNIPGLTVRRMGRRPAVLYEIGPAFGTLPAWAGNDTLRTWHNMRARLSVNPRDTRALLDLASIELDRGNHAGARARLEQAVTVNPDLVAAWLELGEIALILDDGPGARRMYERATAIDPGNVAARIGMGWASLVGRDPRTAAAMWRPVIGLTRDPVTLERMADLYRGLGDAGAEAEARAVLAQLGGPR